MLDLAADFRRDDRGEYRVFVYSERDEIRPVALTLVQGQSIRPFGATITYDLLDAFEAGRLIQEIDGQWVVRENTLPDKLAACI